MKPSFSSGDSDPSVERLDISAFTVPTASPEADGTLVWNDTTIVIVCAQAGGMRSLGYTYADVPAAQLIESKLKPIVLGTSAMGTNAAWIAMVRAIRNLGRPGICSMAIAAV